ncbi:type II secretion system F family protein [Amycolatopsis sp. WQ 127309]|uniref:type II secretion system F family protein n=1 Tax=Amycolatopsis sp. WQ 127309 TaxID=2932773 RepID=UPI001FF42C14|nr:type II secretion system F family protein [Amycolatopsis sp. WQ 127309]UOZ03401.1 type II secretion system F family protein [Amycolatopsis sp. WQ 127309]
MIAVILVGIGTGLGLWLVLTWAILPQPTLRGRLAETAPLTEVTDATWATALARPVLPGLRALGLPGEILERDLRVLGRGADAHVAVKVVLCCTGLLAPLLLQGLLALGDLQFGVELPFVVAILLAIAGFLVPDLEVRAKAGRARAEFRAALSAFLDLVWITLAGGAGVESALLAAADVGHGPAFIQLRRALDAAQLTRTTPWATLRRLGEELDIAELAELAASLALAGTEGAKIRASLSAKAGALRTHLVADAEAEAQAATERMALPVTLLFLGFLGFIAYPAVTQVLNGL